MEVRGTEETPININDYSGFGGEVKHHFLINAAQFITAFLVLAEQFKVFGYWCPYKYLTSRWINVKKHQGRGLWKYELQIKSYSPPSLDLFKTKDIRIRPGGVVAKAAYPWGTMPLSQCLQGFTPYTASGLPKLFRNDYTCLLWEQTQPGDCLGVNGG